MDNKLLLLAGTAERSLNKSAITAQVLSETPIWQILLVGIASSALFVCVFLLIFVLVSYTINFILMLMDKYYEKTGKKRPVKKVKKRKNGRYY